MGQVDGGAGIARRIAHLTQDEIDSLRAVDIEGAESLKRPRMLWVNLALTLLVMVYLVFGGMWIIPDIPSAIIFEACRRRWAHGSPTSCRRPWAAAGAW